MQLSTPPPLSTLVTSVNNSVLQISLNRPECSNAISLVMWDELRQIIQWADQTNEVRVIIILGSGNNFCAGIDLSDISSLIYSKDNCDGKRRDNLRMQLLKLQESFSAFELCRKPIIAAIQGVCVGAGLDLISACDIRICSTNARFSIKEVDLSIVADMGVLQRLPHILSDGILRELAFTGRNIMADEAQNLKLINHVYPNEEILNLEAIKLANTIAEKSPLTIRGIKKIINYSREHTINDGLDYVATWNAGMLLSDDLTEAITAYQQKRPAKFNN